MEGAVGPDGCISPALLTSKLRCVRKKLLSFIPFFGIFSHSQPNAALCSILDLFLKCCPMLPTSPPFPGSLPQFGPLDAPCTLYSVGRMTLLGHGLGRSFLFKTLHL